MPSRAGSRPLYFFRCSAPSRPMKRGLLPSVFTSVMSRASKIHRRRRPHPKPLCRRPPGCSTVSKAGPMPICRKVGAAESRASSASMTKSPPQQKRFCGSSTTALCNFARSVGSPAVSSPIKRRSKKYFTSTGFPSPARSKNRSQRRRCERFLERAGEGNPVLVKYFLDRRLIGLETAGDPTDLAKLHSAVVDEPQNLFCCGGDFVIDAEDARDSAAPTFRQIGIGPAFDTVEQSRSRRQSGFGCGRRRRWIFEALDITLVKTLGKSPRFMGRLGAEQRKK